MSRSRHRRSPAEPARVSDAMPLSARVAWTYLATVFAGMATVLLVVISDQSLTLLICAGATADEDAALTCKLSAAIWIALVGFVLLLLPALRVVKLDWWLWVTMVAAAGLLVATDEVLSWWWWLAAALLPAGAALASADWDRGPRFRRWQHGILLGLLVAAVAALTWWYLRP